MLNRTLAAASTIAALMCLTAGCGEQTTEQLGGMRSPTLSSADNDYLRDITVSNLTEMQSSELAKRVSTNPRVVGFADHMINDHRSAASTVQTVADTKGATLPKTLDTDHQDMLKGLEGKTGTDFDKAYMDLQVKAHVSAVNIDEAEANNGADPDVKAAASSLLPTLQAHLSDAKQIQSMLAGM